MSLPMQKAYYTARALGCYFGNAGSDGTGNVQVFVPFEISDGEFAGDRITWAGTFGEGKSTGFTIDALRNLGWQGDDLSELEDLTPESAARLLPNSVEITCEPDTWDGEARLKVRWVNAPGGGRMTKHVLSGVALKTFAAQMRATLRGSGPRQASTPARQTQPTGGGSAPHPNAPGSRDDIPF